MKKFIEEKEREYIEIINLIAKAKADGNMFAVECYLETYKNLCETIAMIFIKEKGHNDIPYFDYVPEFEYDKLLGEYIPFRSYKQIMEEEAAEQRKEKWMLRKKEKSK